MYDKNDEILIECGNCKAPAPYIIELEQNSKIVGV